MSNKIMVVPATLFAGEERNFITGSDAEKHLKKIRITFYWANRTQEVEENDDWMQPIVYMLVQKKGEDRYVLTRRTTSQSEARLHDKYSIGSGGHVDQPDGLTEAAWREYDEEVGNKSMADFTLKGLILDRSNPVGRVHVGIFYHVITTEELTFDREKDKHEHRWASLAEILSHREQMEGWSQIVVRHYLEQKGA